MNKRRIFGAATLSLVLGASGVTLMTGGAAPAAAVSSSTVCDDEKLYGIVAYPQITGSGTIAPAQIMEFSYNADGSQIESYTEFSNEIDGVVSSSWIPSVDGLGVGADCTFYFAQNKDFTDPNGNIDLYRYNPAEGDTPQLMQQNFLLNNDMVANVNAGAVAPDGNYYFAYATRQTPGDVSGATTESLRLHLFRYAYQAGNDPQSTEQPNALTGKVAQIDIAVDEGKFHARSQEMHGDLSFDEAGNLVYFVSNERTNERLSAAVSAELFTSLPGIWSASASSTVPTIDVTPLTLTVGSDQEHYMGAAYNHTGGLQLLSLAYPTTESPTIGAAFIEVNPKTLQAVEGTTSRVDMPAKIRPGSAPQTGGMYPLDLASNQFAGTLQASLTVDALAADDDTFSLSILNDRGETLTSSTPGDTMTTPVITSPATYTVRQSNPQGDAQRYTTTWSCTDAQGQQLATGTGTEGTVRVKPNQAVSCAFDNVLKQITAATPTIMGKATLGSTLTALPGDWKPAPVTLTYQWLRDGVIIDGATAQTYVITDADLGTKLTVRVTGTSEHHGSAEAVSAGVTPAKGATDGGATGGSDGAAGGGSTSGTPTPTPGTGTNGLATTGSAQAALIAGIALAAGAAGALTLVGARRKRRLS